MTRSSVSYGAGGRGGIVLAICALAWVGTACSSRAGGASGNDPADASVTFQSSVVTTPATWNNLYGSWPAGRFDMGMAYDSDLKRIVMFGGSAAASGPHFGDLWEWDSTKGSWNQRAPNGCVPAGTTCPYDRSGAAMVYDPVRKKTFMFSGWQPGAGFYHADQWEWDGLAQKWTERMLSSQPSARYGHAMVWDSARNVAVMFGGFDETGVRKNDTWEWDGTAWTDKTPAGTKPTPRHGSMMVYDAGRAKTVLYSGNTGSGAATAGTWVDEMWEWDGTAWTKITITAISSYQYAYNYAELVYDASRGKVVNYYYMDQIWEYNPGTGNTGTWTAASPTPTKMDTSYPPYNQAGILYDSGRQRMVVFGGLSYPRALWELNGADYMWTNRSAAANGPIQRQYPGMAFDGMSGKLFVFGGRNASDGTYKQDIWEWSGTDATLMTRTTGGTKPDGRYQMGFTYDSLRDRIWLFGGTGTTTYDDLWYWTPSTKEWTPLTVSGTRPTARYGTWMFYDAARDKIYLFGQNQGGYQNWEYDPQLNTWKDRTVTSPPSGVSRSYFDVAFDSNRGKIVMLGGYFGGVYNTDVWEWDTTTGIWAQLVPVAGSTLPDGRYYHTIAYDSIRRLIVMVGGYHSVTGFSGPGNDSWEWDANLLKWNETTPVGVKPLPRYNHSMAFNTQKGTTYLFGGTVNDDPTYGPSEFWEYIPNGDKRLKGAGCTAATAANCASGNCVDGVCCTQTAAQCNGTCKSCNTAGSPGDCANVPAGLPDDTCASDQACDANQQCKKPLGQQCGVFGECATGHCADGVCCDTDCNDKCKVCNLASKRGTCSFVPSGDEDAPTCVSDDLQGRSCDGAGNCANIPKANGKSCTASAQCQSGFCIDGVCCNQACAQTCYQCDRTGNVGTCAATLIGQLDHSATTPCDSAGQSCNGSGSCVTGKLPNGSTCTANTDCTSNYCVDKICCSSTCTTACQACNVAGSLGSCVNVPAGSQDTNATTPCNMAGQYCDAAGTCQTGLKPNGTTCGAASECGSNFCVDGVCCVNACAGLCSTCNGGNPGTCEGVRAGTPDSACSTGMYCGDNRMCVMGKKTNGAACAGDSECASSYCVDGTCCESVCQGTCRSCANSTGTCGFAKLGTDTRLQCKGELGCGGTCNGQGACSWAPQGKTCRSPGCQKDIGVITSTGGVCDGAGNCPPASPKDCNGFGCDDVGGVATCKTDCRTDPDCQIRRYCEIVPADSGVDGGNVSSCPSQFPLGHACTRDPQCLSGTCAIPLGGTIGVCCNTECNHCGTCDSTGTCIPDPAGTLSATCVDNASDPTHKCGGMCDGHAHCQYPSAGTVCGTCKACNGMGLCNQMPADDVMCGTIDCDSLNVTGACRHYSDLTTNRCASPGVCKMANMVSSCTVFTDTCPVDGGSTGTGGSTGAGGTGVSGTGGRGGTSGTAGAGATGTAGTSGMGTDGGGGTGKGGGGCCAIGGTEKPTGPVALLIFAAVLTTRRRRK